eukprot:UN20038
MMIHLHKARWSLTRLKMQFAAPTAVQEDEKTHTLRNGRLEEPNSAGNVPADGEMVSRVTAEHNDSLTRLKRAAATAVSAAAP